MVELNKVIADRYKLVKLIGQGGMADVYLAEDLILNRVVALKLMRSSLINDPIHVTRFNREARAVASIHHKNIVEIYDVGDEKNNYYIAMEYVPGCTLKELIHKRGALHYVEAVDIIKQITSAIEVAHNLGIIHRDLKPQNIMVTDSGVVKIADFGIASIQSLTQVTQGDTILGSLHYLAPEIARGEKASVQSDIYSIGILMYELLKGDVPFNGETPLNIALKHMRDPIPSIREFNPTIPQAVENIIIRATAKNVKDRYSNTKDMMENLMTCLIKEEEPVVFECKDNQKTIVAENKDIFKKEEEVIEEKPKKKFRKSIIAVSLIAAVVIFLLFYYLFLKAPATFELPDVTNFTKDNAIIRLESAGLVIDEDIIYELSDSLEQGLIIKTIPESKSAVKEGDSVKLVVSSGRFIVVDNYVGLTYEEIFKQLKEEGFNVKIEEKVSEHDKGIIIEQSIDPNTKIDPNSMNKNLILTVSLGYQVEVPNVFGTNIQKAEEILLNAGFDVEVKVKEPPTSIEEIKTMKINVVISQSIDAFTIVEKKGEKIILEYYDKKPEIQENGSGENTDVNNQNSNIQNNTENNQQNNNQTQDEGGNNEV